MRRGEEGDEDRTFDRENEKAKKKGEKRGG